MRLLLNYITRRLLVSALCSATQTALLAPGTADMLFRHRSVQRAEQVVGAPVEVEVLAINDGSGVEPHGLDLIATTPVRDSSAGSI